MDPVTLILAATAAVSSNLVSSVLTVARKPVLLFLVTLTFVILGAASLVLSGLVFRGWWQGFFLEVGVGVLIAGIVDVAVLSALHGLIEGDGNADEIRQIVESAVSRMENRLAAQTVAPGEPNTEVAG
jgi:hypothetical protein